MKSKMTVDFYNVLCYPSPMMQTIHVDFCTTSSLHEIKQLFDVTFLISGVCAEGRKECSSPHRPHQHACE